MKKGYIRLGGSEFKLTKKLCEEELGGKWITAFGCIISSKIKYEERKGKVYIAPLGAKKFPVLIGKRDFKNVTGSGGRLAEIHTYVVG